MILRAPIYPLKVECAKILEYRYFNKMDVPLKVSLVLLVLGTFLFIVNHYQQIAHSICGQILACN